MKLLCLVALLALASSSTMYSVEYRNYKYVLREGKSPVALAWGHYEHDVMTDGWGKLHIWTSDTFSSHEYSIKTNFAAGYLEGALTYEHIFNHYWSWWDYTFSTEAPTQELKDYLLAQDKYTRDLIAQHPEEDYYKALARITAQNDGLFQGIQDNAPKKWQLEWVDLLQLQACGDIYELKDKFSHKEKLQWDKLSKEEFDWEREQRISCSALIKVPADWSDCWVAHTTWTSYSNMLRVYKHYYFTGPKPYRVNFASKPGLLYSKDDFYVLADQQLVVMETTNSMFDQTLLDLIVVESLLTWQRVPISHSLSKGGKDWTSTFIKHNSGTYNNQYIVVDMKKVVKDTPPTSDFVWISETMPGIAKVHDVTQVIIDQGNYWPSYNIPYDTEIFKVAGFEGKGEEHTYKGAPRWKIFERDHNKVTSTETMQTMIRYNDYKNDALSQQDPGKAIANRSDLYDPAVKKPKAFGAIDGKVASKQMTIDNQAMIQSGPSYDNQPEFTWTAEWTGIHYGQPMTFKFPWIKAQE